MIISHTFFVDFSRLGQRLRFNANIAELWAIINDIHEGGSGLGDWAVAFRSSIPQPVQHHWATLRTLSPFSIPEQIFSTTTTSDNGDDEDHGLRFVDRPNDHASWDLDSVTRALQLTTAPAGPVVS